MTKIGVLALQGDFAEHVTMLKRMRVEAVEVRKPQHLEGLDGLIIPGGESTTIGKLSVSSGLKEPLHDFAKTHATWGTCAGAIFLSNQIEGEPPYLGLMDISVRRNAFGSQLDSFVSNLDIKGIEGGSFRAVFIRAPVITQAGPKAEVLSRLPDGTIVATRQGNLLATSFHPELTHDDRIHRYFVAMAAERESHR